MTQHLPLYREMCLGHIVNRYPVCKECSVSRINQRMLCYQPVELKFDSRNEFHKFRQDRQDDVDEIHETEFAANYDLLMGARHETK